MTSTRRTTPPLQSQPLAERAREMLLGAIREDRFPGGRLPPEAELAEQLGISRGTLRAALQSLSAEGVVSRRRRHGTFVNQHVLRSSMPLNRLVSFATLIEQSGYSASTDPRQNHIDQAGADEASELGLAEGTPVLRLFRLHRADGEPVISVADVIPRERLIYPPSRLRNAETTFAFLAENTDTVADYATAEIIPRVADAQDPAELNLVPGTPYIQLREVLFNPDGERIALSVVCVVDRLVRLSLLRRGH